MLNLVRLAPSLAPGPIVVLESVVDTEMKKVMLAVFAVLLGALVLFVGLMVKLSTESRSLQVSVGVADGRLMPCPATPNCVSSDAPLNDSHYIAPIADPEGSRWDGLADRIGGMAGAALTEQRDDYLRFTFTSRFWRFVDDVEFHHRPQAGEIAVRSASRVGRSDWNANRDRMEAIRAAL